MWVVSFKADACQSELPRSGKDPMYQKETYRKGRAINQFPDRRKDKLPRALCLHGMSLPSLQGNDFIQLEGFLLSHKIKEGKENSEDGALSTSAWANLRMIRCWPGQWGLYSHKKRRDQAGHTESEKKK